MDSSICLALAIQEFGKDKVMALSFDYGQRHSPELIQSEKICSDWGVQRIVLSMGYLKQITDNALINQLLPILHQEGSPPNTLVACRNGLMARLAAILANYLGANLVYMGVIEVESDNSGYRDCSRHYMDLMQEILRIDLDSTDFEIRTPIVKMTKRETLHLANQLNILDYLLKETVTCYEGIRHLGCQKCPACILRNNGLTEFLQDCPSYKIPF
jgi:7-cyano-7-deazaguanine synthase